MAALGCCLKGSCSWGRPLDDALRAGLPDGALGARLLSAGEPVLSAAAIDGGKITSAMITCSLPEFLLAVSTGQKMPIINHMLYPFETAINDTLTVCFWRSGEECYCVMDKGPINGSHVLLLPIEHFVSSLACSANAWAEMQRYLSALKACAASQVGCLNANADALHWLVFCPI